MMDIYVNKHLCYYFNVDHLACDNPDCCDKDNCGTLDLFSHDWKE